LARGGKWPILASFFDCIGPVDTAEKSADPAATRHLKSLNGSRLQRWGASIQTTGTSAPGGKIEKKLPFGTIRNRHLLSGTRFPQRFRLQSVDATAQT